MAEAATIRFLGGVGTVTGFKEQHVCLTHSVVVTALLIATAALGAAQPSALDVNAGERLVVVAPHPDDETLGTGGLIQRVIERGGTVRVVLVTAGDGYIEAVEHETGRLRPRPADYVAYGERRLREARRALRQLGYAAKPAEHLLGFPDGGIEPLLTAHAQRTHPERSSTTGASKPPYPEAEHRDVRYDGDDLRTALVRCFSEVQPTMVAFPDPIDRHPDHRATGRFTLLAVKDLMRGHQTSRPAMPRLLAYLVHWPDWPPGWNASSPPARAAAEPLVLPPSVPSRGLDRVVLTLTDREVTTKRGALDQYTSQQQVMPALLAAFVRRTEPFTVFVGTE
jgi:LmbE family N-acetylglucosaminyl deacetylase